MKSLSTIVRVVLVAGLLSLAVAPVMAQANDMAINRAKEFISLLQKGDYSAAYSKVDSNLGFKATPETFKSYWENLISKAGTFVEFKDASVDTKDGAIVVTQVAKFAKGHVDLKVALDNSMRVSGFQYANHKASTQSSQSQAPASASPQAQPAAPTASAPST